MTTRTRKTALVLTVLAAAGCAGTTGGGGGAGGGELIVDFEGPLQASRSYPTVGGSVRAVASLGTTAVFVNLRGGQPGASYAWRIHSGACGSGGSAVAGVGALSALEPDAEGSDRVTATIPVQLAPNQRYHVNVYLSPDRMDELVACGDLTN